MIRGGARARGFTLLEVIIALAITGLAVGALFGLLGGSKRLAFSAGDTLSRAIFQRAAVNAAQLQERPDYPARPDRADWRAKVEAGRELDPPERQTREIRYALEGYTVVNDDAEMVAAGVRWKRLEALR